MASESMGKYYAFAMKAFGNILATILLPVIVAVIIKTVAHLSTTLFFIILSITFVLSAIVLVKKIKTYGRAFAKLDEGESELRGPRG